MRRTSPTRNDFGALFHVSVLMSRWKWLRIVSNECNMGRFLTFDEKMLRKSEAAGLHERDRYSMALIGLPRTSRDWQQNEGGSLLVYSFLPVQKASGNSCCWQNSRKRKKNKKMLKWLCCLRETSCHQLSISALNLPYKWAIGAEFWMQLLRAYFFLELPPFQG